MNIITEGSALILFFLFVVRSSDRQDPAINGTTFIRRKSVWGNLCYPQWIRTVWRSGQWIRMKLRNTNIPQPSCSHDETSYFVAFWSSRFARFCLWHIRTLQEGTVVTRNNVQSSAWLPTWRCIFSSSSSSFSSSVDGALHNEDCHNGVMGQWGFLIFFSLSWRCSSFLAG